ncbi:cysteinyl-tRNA synthetase [Gemmobacter caeni]|uniref:Cysteine--tRNA ligase n=1 Tax=Gemmobacter caeni TaxID=589035 RepID=A0A2T6AXV5_9RHOB|nr:cysteine--tRNA ligase [Gemmobacter caeni]PTX48653.1 cysteinyl-tRNA synthetase [Gemmobacter caeni]TWI99546.1 cysteinyl-tRNA synthetase [Gemmobacter caeni]
MTTTIRLHNTRTRQTEDLVPLIPGKVRMYVCGPTVYDRAHIGNARPVVVFDTLFRLLRHIYGAEHVTYVRNFTDVDDKINAKAAQTGRPIRDITDETIGWYHADMDALGALRPTHEPRATEYIGAMIAMISDLIDRGHAYAAEGHVLFDVRSYADYGKLSGRSVDDMIAGARVEVAPYKRDPMDFVLWKPSDDTLPGWDSPWGRGRPGWHIECSAMSKALLGETFDIHGGGIDLQFPHHENEIAQSCCANHSGQFANIWMHNEMLQVEGKKMSKSLGNFFTVRDLLDQGYPGEVIRFVYLGTHYARPMDWTHEKATQAEGTLRKWRALTKGAQPGQVADAVVAALAGDLNTAGALAELHRLAGEGDAAGLLASAQLLGLLLPELGGWDEAGVDLAPWVNRLAGLRAEAMETKNFAPVDALKTALMAAGLEVRMSKAGVELLPGPGFDVGKLPVLE